jgi:hypothetical protein
MNRDYTKLSTKLVEWNHFEEVTYLFDICPHLKENTILLFILFCTACEKGYLQMAQWLYQIQPSIDITMCNHFIFCTTCHACQNEYLQIAQWLQSLRPDCYSLTITNNIITYYQILHTKELRYFEETKPSFKEKENTCPICSEKCVTIQTTCNHHYCKECLTKWLSNHTTCPYCREKIDKVFRMV